MDQQFDSKTDYYGVLGLTSLATADEIKNAHVTLALKHHPDLSKQDDGGKRFLAISEAWSVLGKPERRQNYDLARIRAIGGNVSISMNGNDMNSSEISDGFNTQKSNFNTAVQYKASSNWRELQDKYKTESWQSMSLSEKKRTRIRGVQTLGGTILPIFLTMAFVGFAGYSYYSSLFPSNRRRAGVSSK